MTRRIAASLVLLAAVTLVGCALRCREAEVVVRPLGAADAGADAPGCGR